MKKRVLIIVAIVLVVAGVIGGIVLRRPKPVPVQPTYSESLESPENQEPIPEAPSFKILHETLTAAASNVDCANVAPLEAKQEPGSTNLWIDGHDKTRFVYLDTETQVITVCRGGERSAGKAPFEANLDIDEQMIDVSRARLQDYDGDGKDEFLVFEAQCVEGPCLGGYTMYRANGANIDAVIDFRADRIEVMPTTPRPHLRLAKACYTYDFGSAFSSVAVVEFGKEGPQLLPSQKLKAFDPAILEAVPSAPLSDSPEDQAFAQLQALVNQAYTGVALDTLLASYQEISENYAHARSSGAKSDPAADVEEEVGLPLHCDPEQLLREISASR